MITIGKNSFTPVNWRTSCQNNTLENRFSKWSKIKFHTIYRCKHCGKQVFYYNQWNMWLCYTWTYMEGGCKFEDNQPDERI